MKWGLWAPAKINLTLDVGELRADGYHEVDSLVLPLALADRLEGSESSGPATLEVVGVPEVGSGPDNLVLRAARALDSGAGLSYRLTKSVPAGGGFGGGSSDGWAALVLGDLAAGGDGAERPARLA
ncbi:4-diphosphocytidyl-2C-methyl-D-erythritol kinase, partial [bacterium]|nr:4-diphosphocytidyl-2C-methyl-D-erythritol kinase [bacterium]